MSFYWQLLDQAFFEVWHVQMDTRGGLRFVAVMDAVQTESVCHDDDRNLPVYCIVAGGAFFVAALVAGIVVSHSGLHSGLSSRFYADFRLPCRGFGEQNTTRPCSRLLV